MTRPTLRTARAVVILAAFAVACSPPKRVKTSKYTPAAATAEELKKVQEMQAVAPAVLPPPTMSPKEIRKALWDIAARQEKGESAKALNDYADRAEAAQTLESRFLAAAAIPDAGSKWDALHEISLKQPKFYWAHAGMADVYVEWKIRDQGEKELNLCFDLGPEITYTYTLRGNLYRRIGEHNLAIRDYATALRGDPEDADARVGLALSRKAIGNEQGFVQELQRALKDVPTHYEAAEALALTYDAAADNVNARKAFELVERLSPKNRTAKLALARLRGDEDPTGAILAYEQAAKLSALSKAEMEALARLYRKAGRTADEEKSLLALTKLDAKDLAPWRRLAEIYEEKNDAVAIESAYKSILALDAKDKDALMGLARLAEKRAQIRQAIDLYREAKVAGEEKADAEISRLMASIDLPPKPLAGTTLTSFYRVVSESLEKLYNKRLVDAPAMKGLLKVRIVSDGEGKAVSVEVLENTLNDPWLEAHLYYALIEAAWPKLKATDPKRFSLTFDLPPEKK